jgi:tetratricopeptide (TPR) repeat protein
MLKKLWQWLKNLWYKIFGSGERNRTKTSSQSLRARFGKQQSLTSDSTPAQDQDLEFLFNQLLKGVINGWQNTRIEKFFHKLEHRITIEEWLDWLQRYERKLLSSSAPNYQLAVRMIALGKVIANVNFLKPIAKLSSEIGEKLLDQHGNNSLVESLRSHLLSPPSSSELNQSYNSSLQETTSNSGEIFFLLQQDHEFAAKIARKLGLQTINPDVIINKLLEVKVDNNTNLPSDTSPTPSPSSLSLEISVEELFKLGLEKAQNGNLEGAIACWDQVLDYNPELPQAWHNRGSALAYLNRLEDAIASFSQAISLNDKDYQSWNDKGNALYNLQRWEEALLSWDRAVTIKPDYYQAWYNRGLALEHLDLFHEALESYDNAIEIQPDFQLALKRKNKLIAKFNRE